MRSRLLPLLMLAIAMFTFALAWFFVRAQPLPLQNAGWLIVAAPGALATLVWLWVIGRTRTARAPLSLATLVMGTLFLAIPLVALPPAGSTDVFAYGYFGRLVAAYGVNPYSVDASNILAEPMLYLTGTHTPFPSPYGPLWSLISAGIVQLTAGGVLMTLFVFRLLALSAVVGITVLLAGLCRHLALSRWHVALFAWQPYVLFEAVNNAHNDFLMLFGIVGAVWLCARRRSAFSLPVLALAVAVKYSAFAALPIFVAARSVGGLRTMRAWASALTGVLLSCGLLVALFLPFWQGLPTFRALLHVGATFAVPPYHPVWLFSRLLQLMQLAPSAAAQAGFLLGVFLFLVSVTVLIIRCFQGKVSMPLAAGITLLAFALLGVQFFQPWYLLWGMPFLTLLSARKAVITSAALGITGFLTYAFY